MKRFFLAALLLISALISKAQQPLPQGSFESWYVRVPSGNTPLGWLTTDDILARQTGTAIPTNTVARTSSSHSGNYAARLTTQVVTGFGAIPGVIVLGGRFQTNTGFEVPAGVPYTSRAARMEFHYTLVGPTLAADSARAFVQLTRTVNGVEEVIAEGSRYLLSAAPAYTLASVPLQYQSNAQPDSLRVYFTSGDATIVTQGTALTIDGVALTGTVTRVRDARDDAALTVYPTSSADGRFVLASPTRPTLVSGSLSVTDAVGREVLTQQAMPGAHSRHVSLQGQAPGVYLLRLATPGGPLTRKLVVE